MCEFIDACMLLSLGVGVHVLAVLQVFVASVSVCVSQLASEDAEPHVKVNTHTVHMPVSVLMDGIREIYLNLTSSRLDFKNVRYVPANPQSSSRCKFLYDATLRLFSVLFLFPHSQKLC